jgi:hypothetical protein
MSSNWMVVEIKTKTKKSNDRKVAALGVGAAVVVRVLGNMCTLL